MAVASQTHRSQRANRDDCEAKLASLLAAAWDAPVERRTRVGIGAATKARRTEGKRRRRDVKARRGRVDYE